MATKLPLVGGHEGAGVVVARGDLVKDIEIGDHAGVKVYLKAKFQRNVLTCAFSGLMAPAWHATSAKDPMSPYVLRHSSPATQSTAHSNNTVSPRPHTLPAFQRNVTSRPSRQFSAPVSPFTRD